MGHATEGDLRRLDDEPLSVPDRTADHVASCRRCQTRRAAVARDEHRCTRLLTGPQLVPDVDAAWLRFQRALKWAEPEAAGHPPAAVSVPRRPRLARLSLRGVVAIGVAALVVAGTAAAATIGSVFAPTHVAPVTLSRSDMESVAAFMGLGDSRVIGGFPTASGSLRRPFGTIRWSTTGIAEEVPSLSQATATAGFPVALPKVLPPGVGGAQRFVVQPRVTATLTFAPSAGSVGRSSVVLSAGPAVAVEYGSAGGADLPTLAVLSMPRPTGVSSGATMAQIEAFLLRQPGIPPELAEEVRLLGDLGTTLPIPVPPNASVRSVQIGGSPGVLVADASNVAAGVVWEDSGGTLHFVAGILDPQNVLHVAQQLS